MILRTRTEFVVAGSGLAGLTAAIELASHGLSVTILEQSRVIGGRAATQRYKDFAMNLGPRAFYRAGAMKAQFDAWSISYTGKSPVATRGSFLIEKGSRIPFRLSIAGLLRSRALTWKDKFCLARILQKTRDQVRTTESMASWIERTTASIRVRLLLSALTRLATYAADLDLLDAGEALRQLRLTLAQSVLYLDGGWGSLISSLVRKAQTLGVEIRPSCPVVAVKQGSVTLQGDDPIDVEGVVLALPPSTVEQITGRMLPRRTPARAACLDLGLRRVPPGAALFGLGLDEATYISTHSEYASGLAPKGGALVHLAMYLKQGESCEREMLERRADLMIPGWRDNVAVSRFLPEMTVVHSIPVTGRPRTSITGLCMPGVLIAGDWVGPEAMLADAAVASGLAAARALIERRHRKVA